MFGRKKIQELSNKLDSQSNHIAHLQDAILFGDYQLFDGEKTAGELGQANVVYPDYITARERAWELQLTNDVAKLILSKWVTWLIGNGLRFNATPPKQGTINGFDRDNFIKTTEYRFRNYMLSEYSDYSTMVNFHTKAKEATYNALVSGDVFGILRVKKGRVTIQLVDGANVQTPLDYKGNNYILDGVEYDKTGKHIAYWVVTDNLNFERVEARSKTGLRLAFLIYGSKFRLNETRGLPMLIEDYEKIKNIERYIDATVKNAEVSSELVLVNEHDATSTGENVFKNAALQSIANNKNTKKDDLPTPSCFQRNMQKMTKGVVMNNTIGAKMKMLKPDAEGAMPDFLKSNLQLIFASGSIPYEVALSVYNSNYSASRAAIKDWEHNLKVKTQEIAQQIYKPFYELWLYNEVLLGNIDAVQLIDAYNNNDYVSITALNKATFTGVSVPSIDPLKEVNAVRKAMGDETTPLMTGEQAAEIVSQQDFTEVQEQVKQERKTSVKPEKNENV